MTGVGQEVVNAARLRWPEETLAHRAMRAAYIEGALWAMERLLLEVSVQPKDHHHHCTCGRPAWDQCDLCRSVAAGRPV